MVCGNIQLFIFFDFLHFFFSPWSTGTRKSTSWHIFSCQLILSLLAGLDWIISLGLKVSENFMRCIIWERFWCVFCAFASTYLVQFPVDHFSYPHVPFQYSFSLDFVPLLIFWLTVISPSLSPYCHSPAYDKPDWLGL